jgi:hypothetical protein
MNDKTKQKTMPNNNNNQIPRSSTRKITIAQAYDNLTSFLFLVYAKRL